MEQQIIELRQKFFKKLEKESPSDESFHRDDITRIKTRDDWLKRFIEHNDGNVQESLSMLWSTCKWRQEVNANELNEDNVNRDYLESGFFYSYGKDNDGKALFILQSKLHTEDSHDLDELKKCIIYWFERLEREGNDQISVFFDMCDSDISNFDVDFTRFLVELFDFYYPNFLHYYILLEMPWILNATLNFIKLFLPRKIKSKIKQVTKKNLVNFIDSSIALKSWGGTNDYVFHFEPEIKNMINGINGKLENEKVHFTEDTIVDRSPDKSRFL
ncbi:hypothetical protein HCN44_000232 [Aphidius gifuensis]|uniref:CRAL-TRIO domain-containing protein n=1 Tax=Aphidius gifuensis TaxID=684658 RepID=A0A834XRN0_APHGI|nr:hypothetical protein HCN44_000232 [Aphidius gifuensis]